MAWLSSFGKSAKTLQSEVSVACPHCGRAAVFAYGEKLPEAAKLRCSFCGSDLRRAFLHEALEEQLRLHKKAQKKLIWYLATTVFTLCLIIFYLLKHEPAIWLWLLLGVNLILLLGGILLTLKNSRYISEIKYKQKQFKL